MMNKGQTSLFEELITDNFAGGGGASTGIELALGRPVNIAINHDPDAILMHRTNHPWTTHYQVSVWDIDPREVCQGRPVGVAWFSPDCKHFSKAKGKALRDRNIRGLAWIVLRWAGTVRPRVIFLENVEEFTTWGPVRKGKPVKKKAGTTFRKWKSQLEELGYKVEHRLLVAADYGAPTNRKRLVLVARCDGEPIRWPERTHAPMGSEEVRTGKCKPWRAAAEIIDWSLPCPSVFDSKEQIKEKYGLTAVRPLADNTMRRIIRGVDKFTIRSGKPFIVGQTARNLIQYHTEQSENVRANGVKEPLPTVDASNRHGLTCASLTEYFGNGNPIDVLEPMHTVTSHDREALTSVHIQKYFDGAYKGCGDDAGEPLSTITALPRHGMCTAHVAEFKGQDIGQNVQNPLRTITASAGEFGAVKTTVAQYRPGNAMGYWPEIRELLNRHCGYDLKNDEVLLLRIGGSQYYIADIGLRMLTPRELYNAMGFPPDYKIDRDYRGNEYSKSKQVARCGNAVCPPMAEAVVRANVPEMCRKKVETMEELEEGMAISC